MDFDKMLWDEKHAMVIVFWIPTCVRAYVSAPPPDGSLKAKDTIDQNLLICVDLNHLILLLYH